MDGNFSSRVHASVRCANMSVKLIFLSPDMRKFFEYSCVHAKLIATQIL